MNRDFLQSFPVRYGRILCKRWLFAKRVGFDVRMDIVGYGLWGMRGERKWEGRGVKGAGMLQQACIADEVGAG